MPQINENPTIPQRDQYSDAFQQFQESRQFKRLQEKFKVRPFFERAKTIKFIADSSGWILNVFSASTAFLFVFSFLCSLVPFKALSVVFTLAFLVILEGLKRFTLPGVFKNYLQFKRLSFGAIAFCVFLSIGSILSSYLGAKEAVLLLSPKPKLIDLAEVRKPFEDRLQSLQNDKADAMKQTWKGKQTVQAAKRLNVIQEQESQIQVALLAAVQTAEKQNTDAMQSNAGTTKMKAEHFAVVTLIFELLLLLCIWYAEYYDFRSLAEFESRKTGSRESVKETNTTHDIKMMNGNAIGNGRPVIQGFTNAFRYSDCQHCGNAFEKKTTWQKFCSELCRLKSHSERHSGKIFNPGQKRKAQTGF